MTSAATTGRGRPALLWALFALLILQALGGMGGGGLLALKPNGDLLQMPLSYLEGSPFPDYRVPGVILLLVLGVFPLVVAIGLLRRRRGPGSARSRSVQRTCGLRWGRRV